MKDSLTILSRSRALDQAIDPTVRYFVVCAIGKSGITDEGRGCMMTIVNCVALNE